MRRTTAASLVAFLVGIPMANSHSAPAFKTGTDPVLMAGGFDQYINLGLQGGGRVSASQLELFGDIFGSVLGLHVTNWKASGTGYTGSFLTLPDRGYNSGAVYSDYRARIQQIDLSLTPCPGATPLAFGSSQFSLQYMGGAVISEVGGSANTGGALPTSSSPLFV
jgi:hypothetical protein